MAIGRLKKNDTEDSRSSKTAIFEVFRCSEVCF